MSQQNLVHGMGAELVAPTWPCLTRAELDGVLVDYPQLRGGAEIEWLSPRPFSSAALVRVGADAVFVKRHHLSVRSVDELAEEHAFMRHLRARGIPAPAVLDNQDGLSATARGDWTYEIHTVPAGEDLYRDALSWTPFASRLHAESAGRLLARLHVAARDFTAPPRSTGQLVTRFDVLPARDPVGALRETLAARPVLADALASRDWQRDVERLVVPHSIRLPTLTPLWTHNDWHASNLLWSDDGQAGVVIDFGLSNRTAAIFDLATALERNTIGWLSLADETNPVVHTDHARALLAGYLSETVLSDLELDALTELLPIVHVEFALSELEYFHGVTRSAHDCDLAYDGYFLGHIRWFDSSEGQRYLAALR